MGKHRFLNDMVFKVVFASATNDHLLRALLNALLGLTGTERITEIHILNPYVDKTYLTEKGVVLDIKARDGQGQRYNIEVQLQDQSTYTRRSLYYLTRLYNEQLKPGDGYEALKKTVGISLLDFVLFPDQDDLHSTFRMHDVEHARTLDDHLEMHYIEITKFQVDKPHALRSPFEKWLHVLKFGDKYEEGLEPIPKVLSTEEGIVMALNAMQRAWMSDEVREMMEIRERAAHDEATRREKAAHDEATRLEKAKADGKTEGKTEGLREAATKLLAAGMDREMVLRMLDLPADADLA